MIRPTIMEDTPALLDLTRQTGIFKLHEIQALDEVLSDYHASNSAIGHVCVTQVEENEIIGFAYYAPAAMTDRSWYLYWIAIRKDRQAHGLGGQLLRFAEEDIHCREGRVVFIETSSLPLYDLTRQFYRKHGYEVTGTIRDFYCDGDDMVVFRKRLR